MSERTDASTPLREHEIVAPVDLCLPGGRLNPDAVGWARHPWHLTDGIGHGLYGFGRNKRWEYWAITTPRHVVGVTASHLDYAGLCQLWVLDRETLEPVDTSVVTPLGRGVRLPGTLGRGAATARVPGLDIEISEVEGGTRIVAESARARVDVTALWPEDHELLAVVVPWTRRLFQYTVKDVARPARGTIEVDGEQSTIPAGESWAVLDHGRGRWPYAMTWNWGAASGYSAEGRVVGLQLGGRWTEGTGSTENALSIDGRITKLHHELVWRYDTADWTAPWTITGPGIELRFDPHYDRVAETELLIVASSTHQLFGDYSGTVTDDAGTAHRIEGLFGWAEHVRNRW